MQYLNIIYFLIITAYGYRFLQSDGRIVKGALNSEQTYHYSGTELFWCLTFATGLLAFSANVGLDLMAIRLLVLEIFCIIGLTVAQRKAVLSFPLKIYIAFLIWIVIGIFYSDYPMYGFRTVLKYIYPLLLCMFASAAVSDAEVFMKSSLWARKIGVIAVIFGTIPYIERAIPGVIWYGTARAINFISIMIFSLGMFFLTNKKKQNFLYTLLFLLPCVLWVFRTSIMGSLIALMAFFLIKLRVKALPIIAGIFVLGIIAVFTIPALKEKMFYDKSVTIEDFQQGKIEEKNINTNTRAYMWEILTDRFYDKQPMIGSGTGSVQGFMYTDSKKSEKRIFSGLMVPHSDFVQQKCDNGLIGLVLYGVMVFFIFVDCFRTYWNRESSGALKLCAIVAGASLIGVYATFYSDNVVNYSMATLSMPFGFYGMMLGMRRAEREGRF